MSYTGRGGVPTVRAVQLGHRAFVDPILARASLDAAKIAQRMATVPAPARVTVMRSELRKLKAGLERIVDRDIPRLIKAGATPDQAAFDAMRMAIANARLVEGAENATAEVVSREGWAAVLDTGLGLSASDRQAGCMVAAGSSAAGTFANVVPVFGQLVGGALQIGSGIAAQALDCGRPEREAQQRLVATQQAIEAQQRIQAAQAVEADRLRQEAERKRRTQLLLIGGAAVAAVAVTAVLL